LGSRTGYYKSELTPDGDFRFYYIDDEGNEMFTTFVLSTKVNVVVQTKVSKQRSDYKYSFKIFNSGNSKQQVLRFAVGYSNELKEFYQNREEILLTTPNARRKNVISWLFCPSKMIEQGGSREGLYIVSPGIPGIVKWYAGGDGSVPNANAPSMDQSVFVNSVSGKAVGPVKFPWEDIPELEGIDTDKMKPHFKKRLPFLKAWDNPRKFNAMIDRLLDYTEQSYEEGWIEEADTKQWIIDSLNDIRNLYNDNKRRETKRAINEFLNDIEPYRDRDRLILTEAYGLLKYNLEYVRDNLM